MADTARETVWLCLTWVNFTVFFKELGFFTKKIVNLQREIIT